MIRLHDRILIEVAPGEDEFDGADVVRSGMSFTISVTARGAVASPRQACTCGRRLDELANAVERERDKDA
jgi:hypothetical protein